MEYENLSQQIETRIPFIDLKKQYHSYKTQIDQAITDCLLDARFIKGPAVARFEAELGKYLGVEHVISCANGTDALQLAFMALELQPGDEIIMPAFTYISGAEAAALLNLKPVFADIDPGTFNIDPGKIEHLITQRTKAILVVHLFGQPAEMDPILKLSRKYNLKVIEDNAQSLGAECLMEGKVVKAGSAGDIACTSFFPSKNLACYGDGGAVYCNNLLLADKVRMIANHGQVVKYQHERLGINSRLDSLQAAILLARLPFLDEDLQRRRSIAKTYNKSLWDINGIIIPGDITGSHTYNQYTVLLKTTELRDELKAYLLSNGIDTMIYYPRPIHLQPVFKYLDHPEGSFPISEDMCMRVLSLPVYPGLEDSQVKYLVSKIKAFLN